MYMVIRDTQPEIAYEISPNAGWSTNYILAALSANERGVLHSFELLPTLFGKPTEAVIRANQCIEWDQQRLVIHVGDARETLPHVKETIDFLLLDSCHEGWFAEWYISEVFPRVKGAVMIQDIAFVDQLWPSSKNPSSEAQYIWAWAERQQIQLILLGSLEAAIERMGLRAGYAERHHFRSNSVYLCLPSPLRGNLPAFSESPEDWVEQAWSEKNDDTADWLLNQAAANLVRTPTRPYRHRPLFRGGLRYARVGEIGEARRWFRRALGIAVQADLGQRAKALTELLALFTVHGQWKLAAQTWALVLLEPRAWPRAMQTTHGLLRAFIRHVTSRNAG